jgi:dTDP-4-dehydrorhamnose 3,5-epimerase
MIKSMKLSETPIQDLLVIEPKIFTDERGYFFESYSNLAFKKANINLTFVQDNESFSSYGVLRGLHFQTGEHAQTKLVRVTEGAVLDVAVDIRPLSTTFGQYFAIELSAENKKQLLIPRGFAHGFVVLSETARLHYKCDNYYNKEAESGLCFNDPELAINWKIPELNLIVNDRDRCFQSFKEFKQKL